jgi:hypothetical protein
MNKELFARLTRLTWATVLVVSVTSGDVFGQQHGLGLILATPEELRGIPLASTPYSGTELPRSVDLSSDLPPPGFQGKQSSCVGWSVAYATKSYQERVEERWALQDAAGRTDSGRIFSPAFIYNQINQGRDGGASFIAALNLLSTAGAATWADMPYDQQDYLRQPSPQAYQGAKRYRIDYWRQINVADPKEIKAHLNAGYPIMFGAITDEGLLRAGPGYIWNSVGGRQLGPHAMVLVGYDDARNAFKLMNSWGGQWAESGYGWVDYNFFRQVAREAYVAKDATNGAAPPSVPPPVPPTHPPVPSVATPPSFQLTTVTPNATLPDRPDLGGFIRFDGRLIIPPGSGRFNQSVIHFYFDAGNGQPGQPVAATMAEYADVHGHASCGTAMYPIPPEGTTTTWAAWIPYNALSLASGYWMQTPTGPQYQPAANYLVAEPILFIDNFGVVSGGVVRFLVQR